MVCTVATSWSKLQVRLRRQSTPGAIGLRTYANVLCYTQDIYTDIAQRSGSKIKMLFSMLTNITQLCPRVPALASAGWVYLIPKQDPSESRDRRRL